MVEDKDYTRNESEKMNLTWESMNDKIINSIFHVFPNIWVVIDW